MKLLRCPVNGPRNIDEFQSLGPVRQEIDAGTAGDADWARGLFRADNRRGIVAEWWRHVPSNVVFLAERDVTTDRVLRTYLPGGAA